MDSGGDTQKFGLNHGRVCDELQWPLQEPVAIKGMEAFLAQKQRARQLAAEQRAREVKAFVLNPRDRSNQPLTIPLPFCLRTDLREVPCCSL